MLNQASQTNIRDEVLSRYNFNSSRYIIAVEQAFRRRLMAHCTAAGHHGLKLSWNQVIPHITPQGSRIVDIAKSNSVSKQAIGQLVSAIETAGYIKRCQDPMDNRSKLLQLTQKGLALIKDSTTFIVLTETEFADLLGRAALRELSEILATLFKKLHLTTPAAGAFYGKDQKPTNLIVCLSAIAQDCQTRLMNCNRALGHRQLKMSYAQVLNYLGSDGARIKDIAEIHGVSKQAISQITLEIQALGYVTRIDDPSDRRAKKIVFTPKGGSLIKDSLNTIMQIEAQWAALIGENALRAMIGHLERLYLAMHPWPLSDGSSAGQMIYDIRTGSRPRQAEGAAPSAEGALPQHAEGALPQHAEGSLPQHAEDSLPQHAEGSFQMQLALYLLAYLYEQNPAEINYQSIISVNPQSKGIQLTDYGLTLLRNNETSVDRMDDFLNEKLGSKGKQQLFKLLKQLSASDIKIQ